MVNKFKLTIKYSDELEKITYPSTFVRAMKEIRDEIEKCECHFGDDICMYCETDGRLSGILSGDEGYCTFELTEVPF